LWIADPALGSDNPPAGWDENDQHGFFSQPNRERGVFDDGQGHVAIFRRALAGDANPELGCE
jgi:hypothetical protein